eukprot:TRINITY_DN8546_c0_g1_i4.p1 TRINITY_DN8546_c0_g1~~TRINITY_DN8546_c0_g1_i4.p1  ORF type:complete len:210 (-),score=15.80 TRINITY_DN8546_c0_g1_i4:23-652(-)
MVNTWILGLHTRCQRQLGLSKLNDNLKQLFLQEFNSLTQRYQYLVTDERSKVHLRLACLMCAGCRVYGKKVEDKDQLIQAIKEQNGQDVVTLISKKIGKVVNGIKVKVFGMDPLKICINTQRLQIDDLGPSFEAQQEFVDDNTCNLIIKKCIYYTFFKGEGMENMCQISCCNEDRLWFERMKDWGIENKRLEWLADGGNCCKVQLVKQS